MKSWLCLLLLAALAAVASGCASSAPSDDNISTIPWNRPQSWEGTGALGGMHPPGSQ